MKNIAMIGTMVFVLLATGLSAQIKVTGNGYVGINTSVPAYGLDLQSIESRSFYSDRNALLINHYGLDPRICSNDKMVFFKSDGTGYATIESHLCIQHADSTSIENITSLENQGLATITNLRGVSFNAMNSLDKRKEYGFLAQEVEPVIPEAVFKNDSTSDQSLAYSYIMPYLVEAIKEQQGMIEALKAELASLKKELTEQGIVSASRLQKIIDSPEMKARLDQNIPNPFSKQTRIGCFIPEEANSSLLYNYSLNGTPLGQYRINGKGKQMLTIDGSNFVPGIYFYKLIIDGKEIGTRKMIFTK